MDSAIRLPDSRIGPTILDKIPNPFVPHNMRTNDSNHFTEMLGELIVEIRYIEQNLAQSKYTLIL